MSVCPVLSWANFPTIGHGARENVGETGIGRMARFDVFKSLKPSLRWFQFRITTLLVLTAIIAIWLGVQANRARDERRGAAAVRDAGGTVRFDYQYSDDGSLTADATPPGAKVIRKAVGDEYFTRVVEANANTQRFTNSDLAQLEGLKELRSLRVFETDITDEGIRSLEQLERLEVVDLRNNHVTDAGLAILGKATKLKKLLLDGTKVTDEGLAHLKELHNLEVLFLSYTSVGDSGLEHLSGLARLKELHLSGTKITDEGLVHIKGLRNLNDLLLTNTDLTDAGLVHIRELRDLGFLSLIGTDVSEAGISELKKHLTNTRINR